jgi:hypothetical protein
MMATDESIRANGAVKQCNKCGAFKPLTAFKLSTLLQGVRYDRCKECFRKQRAEARLARVFQKAIREGASSIDRDRLRTIAFSRVGNAVKTGALARTACERCGSSENVEGHHPDYSKPLEVEWLCRSCHKAHHGALRRLRKARLSGLEG